MTREELIKKLQKTDPDRVKSYLDVLDRLMLRCMVDKVLDNQDISAILEIWKGQVKEEIDFESGARTDFLMGTLPGRTLSSQKKVEDGEALRLSSLGAMEVAKEIAKHNYSGEAN